MLPFCNRPASLPANAGGLLLHKGVVADDYRPFERRGSALPTLIGESVVSNLNVKSRGEVKLTVNVRFNFNA
jgi:hypothetical protein